MRQWRAEQMRFLNSEARRASLLERLRSMSPTQRRDLAQRRRDAGLPVGDDLQRLVERDALDATWHNEVRPDVGGAESRTNDPE